MTGVEAIATIIKSGLCKTNVRHRPSPSLFFFPGISSHEFWPKDLFTCTKQLEDAFPIIYQEYQNLKTKKKSDYGTDEASKLHTGQWDWHSYVLNGKRQKDFAEHCPHTVELLESFRSPRLMTGTPFSYAFFSTLHPNSKIAAHTGPCNLRVRCHFPLEVPEGDCAIRIADTEVNWEVGKPIYFDDSYIHEVWNNTSKPRSVLLFDLWHPELEEEEIIAIQNMFDDAKKKGWLKQS